MGVSAGRAQVVLLGDADRAALTELVDADPYVNAALSSRLRALRSLDPRTFGGALLGLRGPGDRLAAAVYNGGSMLPVGGGPQDWRALAARVALAQRRCTSIVGDVAAVGAFWEVLAPRWGAARDVRPTQPLLVLPAGVALPAGHPGLRAAVAADLDAYTAAAAAMFTEELGVAPPGGGGGYRARVAELIRAERCFGVFEPGGRVLFKADLGAVSPHTCQLQGVWVRPDVRGQGLGAAALAGVLALARTRAPTVSLYVNDFNTVARRLYAKLGMEQVGTLSSVLF